MPVTRWSFEIHRTICEIAWRDLTPAAQAEATRLLATESPSEPFAEACTWADRVRREAAYRWTAPAHYVNLPRGAAGLDLARDCDTICVVTAIPRFAAVLADRSRSDSARREALKWVAHLVGDLHQPLHVGYGDDRGGNGAPVRFRGDSITLHRLWDGQLPTALGMTPDRAADLHADIRPIDRTRWLASRDPVAWANESFAIVERQIYPDVEAGHATDIYVERNRHTVVERVQAAGVRLADLLNQVLGS